MATGGELSMKFHRILGGVDFSQDSVRAFETAVALARAFNAELHLMHVIEAYPIVPESIPVRAADDEITSLEEKATAAMEALLATAAEKFNGVPVTTEVTRGRAYVEILNRARDLKADLIILGARGLTLPEEAFLGSTVDHLMREASCSVLIVRG
jgi:nucleotide-binding universal stress UspA family protein